MNEREIADALDAPALTNFSTWGYNVVRTLGSNYLAGRVTYLAVEIETGREVVLKHFRFGVAKHWAEYEALQREVQVLRSLSHPGIPKYLTSFESDAGFCLVQEYKDAPSLTSKRSFSSEEICCIAIGVLEVLVYLQQQVPPVIHRDITPANILVDSGVSNIYVVDFGLARLGERSGGSTVTSGTPGFIAPEAFMARGTCTAADVYGLGVTLAVVISGISVDRLSEYMDQNYNLDLDRMLHVGTSQKLKRWLKRATAYSTVERFSTAGEALQYLMNSDLSLSSEQISAETEEDKLAILIQAALSGSGTAMGIIVMGAMIAVYGAYVVSYLLVSGDMARELIRTLSERDWLAISIYCCLGICTLPLLLKVATSFYNLIIVKRD